MEKRFFEYINEKNIIPEGTKKIVVGFSGGADSMCLLLLLNNIKNKYGFSIIACHVNHMIRGKSADADMEFCKEICEKLDVQYFSKKVEVEKIALDDKLSVEEAGRKVRYEFFEEIREQFDADLIAVAHHLDDQAETILFNMCRGSGPKGLSGMKAKDGMLIRPLLFARKQEIEQYLLEKNERFCTDATNEENDYSRNYIRNILLPKLEKNINKRATEHIVGAGEKIAEYVHYVSQIVKEKEEKIVDFEDQKAFIDIELLNKEESLIRRELIRSAISKISVTGLKDITDKHYLAIEKVCMSQGTKVVELPLGLAAKKEYSKLIISYQKKEKEAFFCKKIDAPCTVKISNMEFDFEIKKREDLTGEIPRNNYTKWFDYDKIIDRLVLRNPAEGDYFIMDKAGHKKKLRRYFIDEKIPVDLRNEQLVLADMDHVIWHVGGRMDDSVKVTESTKNVLVVVGRGAGL